MLRKIALSFGAVAMTASISSASIRITEWMYSGSPGEWVELTNVGAAPVDLTGWVYDDDSRINTTASGGFSLGGFGVVQPGESVVFTETNPVSTFSTVWNLPAAVKVIGPYSNNLGRNDEINIFDNTGALVDRLTYGDESFPGSPRTQNISANIPLSALGTNNPLAAVSSFVGDSFGSYASTTTTIIGNPGQYIVPEPSTFGLLAAAGLLTGRRRRF